jgi:hypothetical protein
MEDRLAETWLTVPDVCERFGVTPGRIHRFVEERALLGMKLNGVFVIPEVFLNAAEPLPDLRGTALVLLDGGCSEEGAIEWLLKDNDVLGTRPIDAIWQGRKTEVRRLALTLAF